MTELEKELPDILINRDDTSHIIFNCGLIVKIFHKQNKISISLDNGKKTELLENNITNRKKILDKVKEKRDSFKSAAVAYFFLNLK